MNRGSGTIEILIAFSVLLLTMTGVILLSFGNQSVRVDTQTNSEATRKAQSLLEDARALSREDFNLVVSIPPTPDGMYQKSVAVQSLDSYTKKVTANVTWITENNRAQNISLATLLTDWHNAVGGDTCSAVLSGDWKHPQQTSYELGKDLLVPSDSSSGFPITDVDAYNKRLFVTVNNTHGNNNPTLFLFDISNPAIKPVFLTSMDNATGIGEGLNGLALAGNYAYAANAYGANFKTCSPGFKCSQLQVFDITTTPPTPKTYLKIPGVDGKSGQSIGTSIFYKNNMIFLGLAKNPGTGQPEFNIIDVTNPLAPVWKGGYNVGNGVNAIYAKGNYAYIASPNNEELTIVDISDPAHIHRVGGYDAPDSQGNGKSMFMANTTVYLGRTITSANPEFYILDSFNPPTTLPVIGLPKEISSSVNGIVVRDYLAFLITNTQFQIWDISNPATITAWATPLALPGGSGTSIDCEENYMYVGSLPSNDKGYVSVITSL